jgi:ectoine hydroxylase-related dioxygenase (phytanoyl-CoA dioxygenase family)
VTFHNPARPKSHLNELSQGIVAQTAKTLMDDWFNVITANCKLSTDAIHALHDIGFIVVSGAVLPERLEQLAAAYDSAVTSALASADSDIAKIGSTTTRVHDLVNRGPEFDGLYVFQPVLDACYQVIGRPYKLSCMLARTLHPHTPAQNLHVDFKQDKIGWPMIGFILMIDEFRSDNGATRFVLGSHKLPEGPDEVMKDSTADFEGQMLACGPPGSIIIYNGSIWHGYTANRSSQPRRSIQGAFIRREAQAALDQQARIRPETQARIGDLAKYLLDVEPNQTEQAGLFSTAVSFLPKRAPVKEDC